MADTKITALTALTAADPANDVIPIVDVSDTTMAASGTTKKISVNNILSSSPTASGALTVTGLVTAGSATITGDLTVDTNTLFVDAANNRVGMGTATPGFPLDLNGTGSTTPFRLLSNVGTNIRFDTTRSFVTNRNWIFGCDQFDEGVFALAPSTTLGGSTFTNPVYKVSNDGIHTFLDGAGGTRMTLNSTGLGVGSSPLGTAAGRGNVTINGSTDAILALGNAGVLTGYVAQSTSGMDIVGVGATFVRIQTNGSARLLVDSAGNFIPTLQATAPSLGLNSQMVFNLTSNTNLRISVRGTDGTTRVANITLA